MSKALTVLDRILFTAIGLLLGAMVVDVTIQVIFRYVIQNPPVWTEELARYLFIWQIFLATGLAFGRGSHIVVDVLILVLPTAGKRGLLIISTSVVLGFLIVLAWQGVNMVGYTSNTYSTTLPLNIGVVYAALPTGAAISAFYVLPRLVGLIRGDHISAETSHSPMVD